MPDDPDRAPDTSRERRAEIAERHEFYRGRLRYVESFDAIEDLLEMLTAAERRAERAAARVERARQAAVLMAAYLRDDGDPEQWWFRAGMRGYERLPEAGPLQPSEEQAYQDGLKVRAALAAGSQEGTEKP